MGSRFLIGDWEACALHPTLENPLYSGFLQELAACDSRPEAHARTPQLFNWSQSVGEAGEKSFINPSCLDASGAAHPTICDIGRQATMLSISPTTPGTQGILQHPFGASPQSAHTRGFKRSASTDDENDNDGESRPSSRRNTAVKRACNECRQQKVSNRSSSAMLQGEAHAQSLLPQCAPAMWWWAASASPADHCPAHGRRRRSAKRHCFEHALTASLAAQV